MADAQQSQTSPEPDNGPAAGPGGDAPRSALKAMVRGSSIDVHAIGRQQNFWNDAYYLLLHASWGRLLLIFLAVFFGFNLFFAVLYYLAPHGLANTGEAADVPRFWRDFFFSVHTLATIGYGNVYPVTLYANIIVTLEAIVGFLLAALTTGLAFTRFARPTARIMFSEVAVVAPFEGVPAIQVRAINQRHNLILEARATASVLRSFQDDQGHLMRRFADLKLVRDANPVFALSWTLMHKIDETSPFHGRTAQEIIDSGDEIIVVISGTDQSLAQTIHGRAVYTADQFRWGMRFVDILSGTHQGRRTLDYTKFHLVEPVE
jgi:inward rectifier potassium channel